MVLWITWAVILLAQNFSFTFVSRARNSGSLKRHMVAALFSNAIWFVSQGIIFTKLFKIMTGDYGLAMALYTGMFYTAFTLLGSITAHYFSLRTEKGKSAVGSNSKYAQITNEEWEDVRVLLNYFGLTLQQSMPLKSSSTQEQFISGISLQNTQFRSVPETALRNTVEL